jgi:signal transduction histidine kinase
MDALTIIKRSPVTFMLAMLAAVALVLMSQGTYWQSAATLDRIGRLQSARNSLRELHDGVLNAESGQRGYLLTGRKEYLEQYADGIKRVDASLKELNRHYRDEPDRKSVVDKLQALTSAKLSELSLTLRLHEEGRDEAALEMVKTRIGMEQMQALSTTSAALLAREGTDIEEGRAELYAALTLSRIGVAVLAAVGLLAFFLYMRQTVQLEEHEEEIRRLLQVERDRLEVEVKQRTAQLIELTHHLQMAREDERNRLARNLHDELGSLLTSAKLDAARIRSRVSGTAPEALERLAHLVETLNSSIALGRRIIEDLRPSALGNLGLVPALEILAREFSAQSGIEVHCALAPARLATHTELVIFRVVQEAVTNITKYAKARHVWISLASHERQVLASVRDDGVGFDTSVPPRSAYGLLGMRFRVEAEHGKLDVVSEPGHGTLIQVTLPELAADAA